MAWVWVTESPCAARTASTLAAAVVPEPRVLHRDSAAALFDVVMAERTVDKTLGSCASAAKLAVSSPAGPGDPVAPGDMEAVAPSVTPAVGVTAPVAVPATAAFEDSPPLGMPCPPSEPDGGLPV